MAKISFILIFTFRANFDEDELKIMGPNEQMFYRHRKILNSIVNPKYKLQLYKQKCTINLNNVNTPSIENSPMIQSREIDINATKTKPQTLTSNSLRFFKKTQRIKDDPSTNKALKRKTENMIKFIRNLEYTKSEDIKQDRGCNKFIMIVAIIASIVQCVINIGACVIYVFESYNNTEKINQIFNYIDLMIAIFFTFEMISNFYFHPKPRLRMFLRIDTWIDFATIFPEYLSWIFDSTGGFNVNFLRILRVFKIIRILKFQKTLKSINANSQNETNVQPKENLSRLKKELVLFVVSLSTVFFICAGIMLFMNDSFSDAFSEELQFDSAIYYVIITSVSIGYGDIYPMITPTRICVIFMILTVFTFFGNKISNIVALMKESDEFDKKYNLKNHTILFAPNSFNVLVEFLIDFYQNNPNSKVLVIGDRIITKHMKLLLDLNFLEGKLYFLSINKGFDTKSIEASSMKFCNRIFFINDPYSQNPDENDK